MFIGRRDDGTIYGLWTVRQWDGQEEADDDDADVVSFIAAQTAKVEEAMNKPSIEKRVAALEAKAR